MNSSGLDPPTQNHVDRVRLHDSSGNYDFGGPGRGSGWRQRSLSNIDLTSQSRHSFTKQIRDYSSGLYDLYSRIESRKDYQENNGAGEGFDEKHKSETIYDHIVPTIDPGALGAESCSLRRTRSLAVIREETYNDLQISGVRTRRSQLIPRAKLCNRSFFKNRSKNNNNEEDSGSGVDTQTSETRESDDYFANLKKLETEKSKQLTAVWSTDKSDLDSLDSDYFKNSLHQTVNNVLVNGATHPTVSSKSKQQLPKSQTDQTTKYQVLEIEVHNQNIRHSVTTTTTETLVTSQSSEPTSTSQHHQERTDEDTADSLQNTEEDNFEEIVLRADKDQTSECSANNSCELNINYNTLTLTRHQLKSAEFDPSTYEKRIKFREDRKSVVSYDSIYLSSEGSNEHTLVDESIEDPLPELKLNDAGEFEEVSLTPPEDSNSEANLDCLYSQINKTKPKIISFEPKHNLTSFSDTSTRGTLERLTFISSSSQQKEFQQVESKLYSNASETYTGGVVDNQYCSLPDASIGISLRASERIDAKLRLSCNAESSNESKKSAEESTNLIYDSISRFGRAHKKLRQKETFEVVVINTDKRKSTNDKHVDLKQQVCIDLPLINYTPIFKKKLPNDTRNSESVVEEQKLDVEKKSDEVKPTIIYTEDQTKAITIKQISTTKIESAPETQQTCELLQTKDDIVSKTASLNSNNHQETFAVPSVVLGKKKIIVDELAAKANQAIQKENALKFFEQNKKPVTVFKTKPKKSTELPSRIPPPPPLPTWLPVLKKVITNKELIKESTDSNATEAPEKLTSEKSYKEIPKAPKKLPEFRPPKHQSATNLLDAKEAIRNEFKANLTDTLRKRIAQSRELFNARPIRVTSVDNISKLNDSFEINPQLSYKVQFKDKTSVSSKMSRPQILKMVSDTKRVCSVAPRQNGSLVESREPDGEELQLATATTSVLNQIMTTEVKQEFQEKVDSMRCYWSKMVETKEQQRGADEVDRAVPVSTDTKVEKNFVTSLEKSDKQRNICNVVAKENVKIMSNSDDVTSFSPHVEIIELNGDKQTAVVNSHNFEVQDFDHIRYKVMKSDTFQKNILTHSRKEAQFDGLLQYLQDYSFQELLANNNVVIIEPVRTKIEKIGERNNEPQAMNCKITNGSGAKTGNAEQKANLKRHFFYHPIRVNKELLDEELPTPDTVRNARKLFEETLRLRTVDRLSSSTGREDGGVSSNNNSVVKAAAENLRKKTLRHLTIDTSFGGVGSGASSAGGGERRWDSASMSSGVSSGELSSPCECNDEQKDMFSSEENICDDELCESYYVSQDVLAKIRECGSTVTYYGGKVVDKKSPQVSPMTKAIMQEIHGDNKVCVVCQPDNCPHVSQVFPGTYSAEDSLSLKFKLVKSNSCSSRLELAGTMLGEEQLRSNQQLMQGIQQRVGSTSPIQDAEESVRTLVSRLEYGTINPKSIPRIIESKCIEKTSDQVKCPSQQEQSPLMLINGHHTSMLDLANEPSLKPVVDIIAQVTVNSHMNASQTTVGARSTKAALNRTIHPPANTNTSSIPKVGRNRNVDLAYTMTSSKNNSTAKPTPAEDSAAEQQHKTIAITQQLNAEKNAKNLRNHISETHAMDPPPSMVSTKNLKPTNTQPPNATHNDTVPHQSPKSTTSASAVPPPTSIALMDPNEDGNALLAPRLVKWNTLSRFDEKNYVTNDVKLKQKPKYDEIEFEEFEVYDPNNPINSNNDNGNECYDSLNSSK